MLVTMVVSMFVALLVFLLYLAFTALALFLFGWKRIVYQFGGFFDDLMSSMFPVTGPTIMTIGGHTSFS